MTGHHTAGNQLASGTGLRSNIADAATPLASPRIPWPATCVIGSKRFSMQRLGTGFLARRGEIERGDDLMRRGGELWPVVGHCLLRSGQLDHLHRPVHLHDQQGSDPEHRILSGLQRCNDKTEILRQPRRHGGILRQRDATIDGVRRDQRRLPDRRRSRNRLRPAEPQSRNGLFAILDQQAGGFSKSLDCSSDLRVDTRPAWFPSPGGGPTPAPSPRPASRHGAG